VSPKRKSKEPLVIGLIETAVGLVVIAVVAIAFCLLLEAYNRQPWPNEIFAIPVWAKWLAFAIVLVGGAALAFFLLHLAETYREKYHEKAGDGLVALESTIKEADRTIRADVFEVKDDFLTASSGSPTFGGYREVHMPWTRIRVTHRARTPCVMEVVKGNRKRIRCFDNSAYMAWERQGEVQHSIPKKVKIEGREVPTAYSKEMVPLVLDKAEHIFDDGDVAQVKGTIRIEPRQVLFLERGDPLEGEYLTMVTNLLCRLAEKAEREYGTSLI